MPRPRELKVKSMDSIRRTRPSPFFVAMLYILIIYAIEMLSQKMNAGPFFIDMDKLAEGNAAEAMIFDISNMTAIAAFLLAAFQCIIQLLNFGFRSYTLQVSRHMDCGVGDLFDGFSLALKVILLGILKYFFTLILFMLFIVPGVIAFYGYRQAEFLLMDHPDWGPMQCLRESRHVMKGHKLELFLLDLSFILLYFLSMFIFTKVFIDPYIRTTQANFYNVLAGYAPGSTEGNPPDGEEKKPWEY